MKAQTIKNQLRNEYRYANAIGRACTIGLALKGATILVTLCITFVVTTVQMVTFNIYS